jgi:glycerol uptake facilitator-like aquaporin
LLSRARFAGIAPHDVRLFVVAQLLGATIAAMLARWFFATNLMSALGQERTLKDRPHHASIVG